MKRIRMKDQSLIIGSATEGLRGVYLAYKRWKRENTKSYDNFRLYSKRTLKKMLKEDEHLSYGFDADTWVDDEGCSRKVPENTKDSN